MGGGDVCEERLISGILWIDLVFRVGELIRGVVNFSF